MSVRCLLGYHKIRPTKTVVEESHGGAVKSYTNAICLRCKRRSWMNWYPLPEQQASVGATGEMYCDTCAMGGCPIHGDDG